jgi:hypothetical protein
VGKSKKLNEDGLAYLWGKVKELVNSMDSSGSTAEDVFNHYYGLIPTNTEIKSNGTIVTTNSEATITTTITTNNNVTTVTEKIVTASGKTYTKTTTINGDTIKEAII